MIRREAIRFVCTPKGLVHPFFARDWRRGLNYFRRGGHRLSRIVESRSLGYFRLIYTILKRIDRDSVLSDAEKIAYANLLRGQLGSPEVNLLALNGLTPASKDLADFLNRFRMLKYLTDDLIRELVAPHYSREAFEGRDD